MVLPRLATTSLKRGVCDTHARLAPLPKIRSKNCGLRYARPQGFLCDCLITTRRSEAETDNPGCSGGGFRGRLAGARGHKMGTHLGRWLACIPRGRQVVSKSSAPEEQPSVARWPKSTCSGGRRLGQGNIGGVPRPQNSKITRVKSE